MFYSDKGSLYLTTYKHALNKRAPEYRKKKQK